MKKPIVPKTAQLDRLVAYADQHEEERDDQDDRESKSLVWNQCRSAHR